MSRRIAYVIGMACLRLKGHYLAVATLAVGEIVFICLNAAVGFTGGPSGLAGIPSIEIGGFSFDSDFKFYYLVWAVFILLFILTANIINSRSGRALRCLHSSEHGCSAMGINVTGMKVTGVRAQRRLCGPCRRSVWPQRNLHKPAGK